MIDPDNIHAIGDGSCLETGACHNGKPNCNCRAYGIYKCSCDRLYSDRTANWGYDSYHECYYFGHKFYQIVEPSSKHDLPLAITIAPASTTDFTQSMITFERLIKSTKDMNLKITKCALDAGHDSMANHEYFEFRNILPVIPLNKRTGKLQIKDKVVNEDGIPLCPGGKPMKRMGRDNKRRRQYFGCPVKRGTHRKGQYVYVNHIEECPNGALCQKDTKHGPVTYIAEKENLRTCPVIPRDSKEYRRLMNLRSGVERSNNQKKIVYKLNYTDHRRSAFYLIKLYLISILEHAKAWLAEDKKNQPKTVK